MKKIFFALILFFSTYCFCKAQYYGDSVHYYVGTTIQLKTKNVPFAFILKDKFKGTLDKRNVYLPSDAMGTDLKAIQDAKFFVERVDLIEKVNVKPNGMSMYKYILQVKDVNTNQLLFIPYPDISYLWSFDVIQGERISFDDFICKSVITTKDKFTDEISYRFNPPYTFFTKNQGNYYLYLENTASTAIATERGVYLIFGDGTRKHLSGQEVKCDVNQGKFRYSTFISLTKGEVEEIAAKGITDYRLYVSDTSLPSDRQKILQAQARCLLSK